MRAYSKSRDEYYDYVDGAWRAVPKEVVEAEKRVKEGGRGGAAWDEAWRSSEGIKEGFLRGNPVTGALYSGAQMLGHLWPGSDPAEEFAALPEPSEEERMLAEMQRREYPLTTMAAGSAPYLAAGAGIGAATKGMHLGMRSAAQALGSAGVGAGQEGTIEERGTRGAIDAVAGAAGEGIGSAMGRFFAPGYGRSAASEAQGAAELAAEQGYKVYPSSIADVPLNHRQVIEGGLEATPGGAQALGKAAEHNQKTLNQAAAAAIGETADNVRGDVLSRAREKIGNVFEKLASLPRRVRTEPEDLTAAANVIDEFGLSPRPTASGVDPVERVVGNVVKQLEQGSLSLRDLHRMQSQLGKQAKAAFGRGDPDLGHALRDLQDLMMTMMERGLGPDEMLEFQQARRQYRYLMALESGQAVNTATGDVNARSLHSILQRRSRAYLESAAGTGEPLEVGTKFLGGVQQRLPSSGTAERQWLGQALTSGGAIGGGVAGGEDEWLQGAAGGTALGLLSGVVAPNLLARAYLTPTLRNYFLRQGTDVERALMELGGLAIGRAGAEGAYPEGY